jgi:hypothetical protein
VFCVEDEAAGELEELEGEDLEVDLVALHHQPLQPQLLPPLVLIPQRQVQLKISIF